MVLRKEMVITVQIKYTYVVLRKEMMGLFATGTFTNLIYVFYYDASILCAT